MCGRIFQTLPLARLLQIARAKNSTNGELHTTSYNVCPTTYIPVIKPNRFYIEEKKTEEIKDEDFENEENRELTYMKWGHQSKFNFMINGRIEEMLEKRTFLNIIKNRCVVIMEGYYEWNTKKEPFSMKPKDADHFLVAALYTDEGETIILTKDATPELAKVHHRMPVFLSHEEVNLWMNPKNTKDIQSIIHKSILKKEKQVWKNVGFAKIAPHVNTQKEKTIKCLMTVEEYKKQLDKTGLMRFWKKPPAVEAVSDLGAVKDHEQIERKQIANEKDQGNFILEGKEDQKKEGKEEDKRMLPNELIEQVNNEKQLQKIQKLTQK